MAKIAIVARAPSSRYLAPFTDESWEIWTLSPMGSHEGFTDLPRFDRWYEIHAIDEKECECPGYLAFMQSLGNKVWIREPHPELPEANIFPTAEVVAFFQQPFANEFRYFNNSVSLMMAHAMYESGFEADGSGNPDRIVTDLGLWGVDMCQYEEYARQAPSCECFVGYAAGAGINVHIPQECDLLKTARIYGIETATHLEVKSKLHRDELHDRLRRFQAQLNEARQQHVGAAAGHGELGYCLEQMNGDPNLEPAKAVIEKRRQELLQITDNTKQVIERLDTDIKMVSGALEENTYMGQLIA